MNYRTLTILVHFIFGPVLIQMPRGIDLVRLRDTSLIVLIFASNLISSPFNSDLLCFVRVPNFACSDVSIIVFNTARRAATLEGQRRRLSAIMLLIDLLQDLSSI